MTEIETYRGPASDLVEWGAAAKSAYQLAEGLTKTQFVPEQFRGKPVEAMAAIVAGAEVGLSPMQALQSTFIIGGRPAYYARTMVALVQRQGHEVWTEAETPASVTVCGRRSGSDKAEKVTVTLEQARKAGWTRNKQYDTNPTSMLWARAASTVCRRIAADALLGIPYTAEELADEAEAGKGPATRKVSRVKATIETPEPAAIEPPAQSVPDADPTTSDVSGGDPAGQGTNTDDDGVLL
jgi:hypothetical protein